MAFIGFEAGRDDLDYWVGLYGLQPIQRIELMKLAKKAMLSTDKSDSDEHRQAMSAWIAYIHSGQLTNQEIKENYIRFFASGSHYGIFSYLIDKYGIGIDTLTEVFVTTKYLVQPHSFNGKIPIIKRYTKWSWKKFKNEEHRVFTGKFKDGAFYDDVTNFIIKNYPQLFLDGPKQSGFDKEQ